MPGGGIYMEDAIFLSHFLFWKNLRSKKDVRPKQVPP